MKNKVCPPIARIPSMPQEVIDRLEHTPPEMLELMPPFVRALRASGVIPAPNDRLSGMKRIRLPEQLPPAMATHLTVPGGTRPVDNAHAANAIYKKSVPHKPKNKIGRNSDGGWDRLALGLALVLIPGTTLFVADHGPENMVRHEAAKVSRLCTDTIADIFSANKAPLVPTIVDGKMSLRFASPTDSQDQSQMFGLVNFEQAGEDTHTVIVTAGSNRAGIERSCGVAFIYRKPITSATLLRAATDPASALGMAGTINPADVLSMTVKDGDTTYTALTSGDKAGSIEKRIANDARPLAQPGVSWDCINLAKEFRNAVFAAHDDAMVALGK